MKNTTLRRWVAQVITGGRKDYRRVKAATMEEAIERFKEGLSTGETLAQVKGGHFDGEMDMPEASEILNYTA